MEQNDVLLEEKRELDYSYKTETGKLRNLKVNLRRMRAIIGGWILLPFLGATLGAVVGNDISENGGTVLGIPCCDYKVATKTYKMKTNENTNDTTITYEHSDYNYKINIKKCLPWIRKQDETGYTREVLEYEYIEKDSNKDINVNEVLESITPKYHREEKETLTEDDNQEIMDIIVTESQMDKSDYKANLGFILTLALVSFITLNYISTKQITDIVVGVNGKISLKELKEKFKNANITIKRIEEKYIRLGNQVVKLQEEYQNKTDDLVEEISPELLDVVKKYVK